MASVVITGGAGFLGSRLARRLLAAGSIDIAGSGAQPLWRVTLIDQAPVPPDLAANERVDVVRGGLDKALVPGGTGLGALAGADVVFHLAAAVSGECEADFDLGMRANVHATELLLESCRALGTSPVMAFSSSVAVFGTSGDHRLPDVVDDQTLPNPQWSYGAQKVVCEQLLADYTRKDFVRGRAIRLATISVRPGRPNAAASGFLSGIVREPLAGQRAVCPVEPATEVALASPDKAIDGLICAAAASDEDWGGRSPVNLPSLSITVAGMVAALERVAGAQTASLIDWAPDPEVARLVISWPARFRSERAGRLGLTADPDFDTVIRTHLAETRPPA
jgi:D-erythronate 2-dehydrogenase